MSHAHMFAAVPGAPGFDFQSLYDGGASPGERQPPTSQYTFDGVCCDLPGFQASGGLTRLRRNPPGTRPALRARDVFAAKRGASKCPP